MTIFAACMFGGVCGILYAGTDAWMSAVNRVLTLPYRAVCAANRRLSKMPKETNILRPAKIFGQVRDYIFFTLFGVGYILLSYAFLDGVFRFFGLLFVFTAFLAGHKYLGKNMRVITQRLVQWTDARLLSLLTFLCLPLVFVARLATRHIYAPVLYRIKQIFHKFREKRQGKRKHGPVKEKNILSNESKTVWHTYGPAEKFVHIDKNDRNGSRIVDKNN